MSKLPGNRDTTVSRKVMTSKSACQDNIRKHRVSGCKNPEYPDSPENDTRAGGINVQGLEYTLAVLKRVRANNAPGWETTFQHDFGEITVSKHRLGTSVQQSIRPALLFRFRRVSFSSGTTTRVRLGIKPVDERRRNTRQLKRDNLHYVIRRNFVYFTAIQRFHREPIKLSIAS